MSTENPIPRQEHRGGTEEASSGRAGAGPDDGLGRLVGALGGERRLVPVLGGLAGVAALASMIGEWTLVTIPNADADGNPVQVANGVTGVGGLGSAYLVGGLAVAACLALALHGSRRIRPDARIAGLAGTAGLLAVLAAATATLPDTAERTFYLTPMSGFKVEYGRGMAAAWLAVVLVGLAMVLVGRAAPAAGPDAGPDAFTAEGDDPSAGYGSRRTGRLGWPWRRRGRGSSGDAGPADSGPLELTVAPAPPFVRPDRDTDD